MTNDLAVPSLLIVEPNVTSPSVEGLTLLVEIVTFAPSVTAPVRLIDPAEAPPAVVRFALREIDSASSVIDDPFVTRRSDVIKMTSLPLPPMLLYPLIRVSLPPFPMSVSSPPPPSRMLSLSSPINVSLPNPPVTLSIPEIEFTLVALPVNRLTVTPDV